jgi:hypothetical protein
MIPFSGAATALFSKVPVGNLCVIKYPYNPQLALRVQGIKNTSVNAAVVFEPSKHPTYMSRTDDPLCVDLGWPAAIRVPSPPSGFSAVPNSFAPGNLVIQGSTTCIIAYVPQTQSGFSGEVLIEVSTGKQVATGGDQWFVRAWQLGITDADSGQFHKLYEWPAPNQPATPPPAP